MHQLQNLRIQTRGRLFSEKRTSLAGKDIALENILADGAILVGKHLLKDVYLFKKADEYLILSVGQSQASPSIGIVVESIQDALKKLWAEKDIDVFDGGVVGELSLHIPAFRTREGQIVYLIDKNRESDFFISDFQIV